MSQVEDKKLCWEFQYAQSQVGPFVLEAALLPSGRGEWKISGLGGLIATGTEATIEQAMRAAENRVRDWITEVGKVLSCH